MTEHQQTSQQDHVRHVRRRSSTSAQLLRLLKLSAHLISILDPHEMIAVLIPSLVTAMPSVQAGMLWLDQQRRLNLRALFGLPLTPAALQNLYACQLRPGEGLAGRTLLTAEPQLVETNDGYRTTATLITPVNEIAFQQLHDQLPTQLTVATLPLRVGSEIIGVLELINLGSRQINSSWLPLVQHDLLMLQTFADLAAQAITNAQLHLAAQRSATRLKAFDAVVTAISTATDLNDLVQSVLSVVIDLIPGASGALLLLEPLYDQLTLAAHRDLPLGAPELLATLPVSRSPCAEVVHYGQPIQRPLLEERGEGLFIATGLTHATYMPLLAGGTVAGVLALYGKSELTLHADRDLLMPICNQVGFAIANVRLYADTTSERRKLHTVVTSIAEGVLLCDAHGRLTLANEAALRLLRLDSLPFEQPLGEMSDFYRMRDLEGRPLTLEQLPFTRALTGELFQDYRLIVRGASGDETVMSFSGAPAHADDGTIEGAVVVFRDITASQRLERAKDEFLAVAAHELRSPLAAVRSYADLLLRREQQRDESDPRDLQGLTILTQQVGHMLRMVDNLLDLSRLDAGQLDLQIQRVNLVSLVNQVLDQQRPAAGGRTLKLDSAEERLIITCDPLRIRQVLTNLISNAIKYTPPESSITVQLHCSTEAPSDTHPSPRPVVVISVHDEGAGIPPAQQARLFQRYYRARGRRAEGLGLGLYLSRQFVQMHGGTIWVESVEGVGSTFAFSLPLEDGGPDDAG